LTDHKGGHGSRPPSKPPIIPLWPWCIAKIKRYFHKRRAQRGQEKAEERSSRVTATATVWIAVFAVVAAGAAISQAIIGHGQLTAIQGQLDEMRTARRPWLTVDTTIAGPLTFAPAPQVWLKFAVTNIGVSPAMEAWINATLITLDGKKDAVQEMHKQCTAMRKKNLTAQAGPNARPPGYVLFPNRTLGKDGGVLLDQAEYDKWQTAHGRAGVIFLDIIVCADYRFSFAPDIHSTDMIYLLGTSKASPTGRPTVWVLTTNVALAPELEKIEQDDLRLYQEPIGNTYAD
jgi:hypothetical protein